MGSFSAITGVFDVSVFVCCRCCFNEDRLTDENGSINVRRMIFENELNDGRDVFLLITDAVVELVSLVDIDTSGLLIIDGDGLFSTVGEDNSSTVFAGPLDGDIKALRRHISFERFKYFSNVSIRLSP